MNDFWNKILPGSVKTDHGKFNSADLLIIVLDLILLGYTCYRSFRFLQNTFASNDTTGEYTVAAIIALVGLDIAAVAWSLVWMFGSTTKWQDIVSLIMFIVSIIGMVLTSMTDTLSGEGTVPEPLKFAAYYGVPAIILLNVAAGITYHMISPQVSLGRKERRMQADILETQRLGEITQKDTAMKLELAEAHAKQNDELIARQQRLAEQKMTLDGIRLGINRAMSDDETLKRKGEQVQQQITANVAPQATLAATAPALPPQPEVTPAPAPQPIPVLVARETNETNWASFPTPTDDEQAIDLLKRFPIAGWNQIYINLFRASREKGISFSDTWTGINRLCLNHLDGEDNPLKAFNQSDIAKRAFLELQPPHVPKA